MTAPADSDQAALALLANLPAEAPVGLALLDAQQRILIASPSLARLCRRAGEELTGRVLRDILPARAIQPVEAVGGSLLVETEPGAGTTVTAVVPA